MSKDELDRMAKGTRHVISRTFPRIIKPSFNIDHWIIFSLFVIIANLTAGHFTLRLLYSYRARLKNTTIILDGVSNKLLICKAVFPCRMFSVHSHVLDGDTSITKDLHIPNIQLTLTF